MVAPVAPDGGWRKWFLEHPHQHTKYPVMRTSDFTAVWQEPEVPPTSVANYDVVEMWYSPHENAVWGTINGGPKDCFSTHQADPEEAWQNLTGRLFRHLVASAHATPPEPVGTGWDDFDWSK